MKKYLCKIYKIMKYQLRSYLEGLLHRQKDLIRQAISAKRVKKDKNINKIHRNTTILKISC